MRAVLLFVLAFAATTLAVPSCSAWCAVLFTSNFTTLCGTTTPNFDSEDNCNQWCNSSNFTVGTDADTSGNTLGCRIYHANFGINTSDTVHCDHASMMGGEVCGTRCESYCQNMMYGPCVGAFTSMAACMSACSVMPTVPANGSDITANTPAFWTNDVQCRDYHGGYPSIAGIVHCAHAWVTGGGACGDICTGYCQTYFGACNASGNLESGVTSVATCVSKCQAITRTTFNATAGNDYLSPAPSGDTVHCRTYHAIAAFSDAATHCPHAWMDAPTGTPCATPATSTSTTGSAATSTTGADTTSTTGADTTSTTGADTTSTTGAGTSSTTGSESTTSGVEGVVPMISLILVAVASRFF